MECNREQAEWAIATAENKFKEHDIEGAKRLALKAQRLFPTLDGVATLIAAYDVHLTAANKVNGETDWYGILGISGLADLETIKRQYKKFAKIIHPDKNISVAADGAFKLITEAKDLLSDISKRRDYDSRRKPEKDTCTSQPHPSQAPPSSSFMFPTECLWCKKEQNCDRRYLNCEATCIFCKKMFKPLEKQDSPNSTPPPPPPPPPSSPDSYFISECSWCKTLQICNSKDLNLEGTCLFCKKVFKLVKKQAVPNSTPPPPPPPPHPTFLTECSWCKAEYTYDRKYMNEEITCPKCEKIFVLVEKQAVPNSTLPPSPSPYTFLTECSWCKKELRYNRKYLNRTVRCPNCKQRFVQVEKQYMPNSTPASSCPPPHIFLTECSWCKKELRYNRKYLNGMTTCPNCKNRFIQVEKGMPNPSPHSMPSLCANPPPATFWTVCYWCTKLYIYDRKFVNCNATCIGCNTNFVLVDGQIMVNAASQFLSHFQAQVRI